MAYDSTPDDPRVALVLAHEDKILGRTITLQNPYPMSSHVNRVSVQYRGIMLAPDMSGPMSTGYTFADVVYGYPKSGTYLGSTAFTWVLEFATEESILEFIAGEHK